MGTRGDRPPIDPYVLLGVARAASAAELRRAFRTLALRHHPDRAGVDSTEHFQLIAEAYAILSDPERRARYDDRATAPRPRGPGSPGGTSPDAAATSSASSGHHHGEYEGPGGRIGWRRARPAGTPAGRFLAHLSGSLDALLARGQAQRRADGIIDLMVDAESARTGGHAAIDAAVAVTCPTCGGHAGQSARDSLWCRRCEYAGTVIDEVTFTLELPPAVRPGAIFTFVTDPTGNTAPVRLRVNLAAFSPR